MLHFLIQILVIFLTWLTTFANATPLIQKVVLTNYSYSFPTTENQKLESEVNIGVLNFARSGIPENSFSQKSTSWDSFVLKKMRARMSVGYVNAPGNSLFSKSTIDGINGFIDNVASLATQQGLNLTTFKALQLKAASELALTNPQGLSKIISIRNSIPNPDAGTIMQKVIPLNKIDDFTVKGYKPRGFVTTAANSKHLNTYEEIYDGMRLDYSIDNVGTQAFNSTDNGCYVIRFKATNSNQATSAVNLPDPDPFPYTNHGFTSGRNGKLGVPEWKMSDAEITEGIIYLKQVDGTEIEYAVFDKILNKFVIK